ncbi:MAG: sulfatase-like hydrolase/transferase, partial [Armatimonadia bacterium]|nr:sulfatase-like hydrolase/transferase [Armatimonadia bacterium]
MRRRHFIQGLTGAMSLAPSMWASAQRDDEGQAGDLPNLIMIVTDDHSTHLGLLGTRGLSTPHLDRIASEGTYFERAYASATLCSPARGALLTGMYGHTSGHWRNTITPAINEPDIQFTRQSTKLDHVGVHEDLP